MFVFGNFTEHVKLWPRKAVTIDNGLFKLHYRVTFLLLLVCTILVSSRQFVEKPIHCMGDKVVAPVINSFCFFSSTFTIARYHDSAKYRVGTHVIAPGVGPADPRDEMRHHAYFQWVPFVLFAQAMLFYLPHKIWKGLENGRLSAIVNSTNSLPLSAEKDTTINDHTIDSNETKKAKEEQLKEVYLSLMRFKINRDWSLNFFLCEILNLVNLVMQIYAVDKFFEGQFVDLGMKWLEDENTLENVFPKVTKCIFHKYGSSGSIQNHDTICVLAVNVINEKVYIILWFWFAALLLASGVGLIWRIISFMLHNRSMYFNRLVWGEINPGLVHKQREMRIIAENLPFSDWLFLCYLGMNMENHMFQRFFSELASTFDSPLLVKKLYPIIEDEV